MAAQRLGLHLTDRCQLDCQHCLRDPRKKPRDLSLPVIERALSEAGEVYGIRDVSFTGGEPTLHPDFCAIVDAVAARDMRWDMVTNGRDFAKVLTRLGAKPQRFLALRSLTLSLDSANEELHDALREPGNFRSVMSAATACVARGIAFGIQMAVHARNQQEIEQVGLLAAQLGAKHVSFAMTQPTGTHHDAALYLSPADWRTIRRRVEHLARSLAISVVLPEGHHSERPFGTCGPFRSETLHVDVEGRLTLCCLHSDVPAIAADAGVAGSLAEMSLTEAHRNLLEIIHREQVARIEEIAANPSRSEWDQFACNRCLARFGRPHWVQGGASGAKATRERWRGAWEPKDTRHQAKRRLTLASR
jgi:MoaA/NifB/PqqE/SkfB family radical SAM enzyme